MSSSRPCPWGAPSSQAAAGTVPSGLPRSGVLVGRPLLGPHTPLSAQSPFLAPTRGSGFLPGPSLPAGYGVAVTGICLPATTVPAALIGQKFNVGSLRWLTFELGQVLNETNWPIFLLRDIKIQQSCTSVISHSSSARSLGFSH